MVNRIVSRLRVGACLLGLFSFVFATAQTPPVADDDSLPIAILIKALTPVCSSFTATPVSVLAGGSVALTATCTNSPTTYEWYRDTTLLATTATATYSTTAPATVATYIYSVVAKRGSIPSLRKSANVSVNAIPPIVPSITSSAQVTVGNAVAITASFSGGASPYNIRILAPNGTSIATCAANSCSANWTAPASGAHQLRVEFSDSSGRAERRTTTIVATEKPAVVAMAIPATSGAGATAASFALSEMGAAQLSIPIVVPPGTGGMQPAISLNYSSQNGNGVMGMGWSIGGFSSVRPCAKSIAQDGYKTGANYDKETTNDAYCLDGQRLIETGTRSETLTIGNVITNFDVHTFRTEIDAYARVEGFRMLSRTVAGVDTPSAVSGFNNFRVYTKAGQIMDYGYRWWGLVNGAAQAVVSEQTRGNTVGIWPVDRVTDVNGNRYVVDYTGVNNSISDLVRAPIAANSPAPNAVAQVGAFPPIELHPSQITYTTNEAAIGASGGVSQARVNRVVFVYENRLGSDTQLAFDQGGGQFLLSKRLAAVKTYVDGNIIDYPLIPYVPYVTGAPKDPTYPDKDLGRQLYPVCVGADCGQLVKTYQLTYEASPSTTRQRLKSVTECESGGMCLSPTNFSWSESTTNFQGAESGKYTNSVTGGGINPDAFQEFQVADVDGDGRSDFARRYGNDSPSRIQVHFSRAGGWEYRELISNTTWAPTDAWGFADLNGDGRADFWVISNDFKGKFLQFCLTNKEATQITCTGYNDNDPRRIAMGDDNIFLMGDFNGDGIADLLLNRGADVSTGVNSGNRKWDLHLGTPSGPSTTSKRIFTPLMAFPLSGDFNGDGRLDLISQLVDGGCDFPRDNATKPNCTPEQVSWNVSFSRGELDAGNVFYNPTLLTPRKEVTYALATNQANSSGGATGGPTVAFDFNGDGLADLMSPTLTGSKYGAVNICLSAGDGTFATSLTTRPNGGLYYAPDSLCKTIALPSPFEGRVQKDILFGDFDGDGRTDLATDVGANGQYVVCLSRTENGAADRNSIRFECSTWTDNADANIGIRAGADKIKVGDFNGDGKSDFAHGSAGWLKKMTAGGDFPDLLVGVTNGMGAFTRVTYLPLTDAAVYTKGSTQTGKRFDAQMPMYVVREVKSSSGTYTNGVQDSLGTTYKYEGLIGSTDGRGMLGFAKRTEQVFNGQATIITETSYEQEWWKVGRVGSLKQFVKTGTNLPVLTSETITGYEKKDIAASNGLTYYQVHATLVTNKVFDYVGTANQALPYTVTTTPLSEIDGYGNVKSVKVSTFSPTDAVTPLFEKETVSAFGQESIGAWILGRVTRVDVTHKQKGDTQNIVRSSSFTYDAKGRLDSETVEPDALNIANRKDQYVSTKYSYDTYGNRNATTVSFYENDVLKTRSSSANFPGTLQGRFATTVSNALGHTETRTFDPRFGGVVKATDPNNITAYNYYDGFGRKVAEEVFDGTGLLVNRLAMTIMNYAARADGITITTSTHTGGQSINYMDNQGRTVSAKALKFAGGFAEATTVFDQYGRKISMTAPLGGVDGLSTSLVTTYEYDAMSRIIKEKITAAGAQAGYSETSTGYDVQNIGTVPFRRTVVSRTGAQHGTEVVAKYADSQGRTERIVDGLTQTIQYFYDAIGNLRTVTGLNSISETIAYDVRGRKISSTNASLGGNYTYKYNGLGELIQQTDPKNQVSTMEYDALGRMVKRDEAGYISTWVYDTAANGVGKLQSTSLRGTTHNYNYDAQSRNISVESFIDGSAFANTRYTLYNPQGQVSYIGYPRTTVDAPLFGIRYTYNVRGFAEQVIDSNTSVVHWKALTRYDDGSLATAENGGAPYKKNYDLLGRMNKSLLQQASAATVHTSEYTYDSIGNVLTRAQTTVGAVTAGSAANFTESFCYDKINRVTAAVACSLNQVQFEYNSDGNLIRKAGATGNVGAITYGTTARTNGAGPNAVATAQGRTYVYDANGNFTNFTDGSRTIAYTPFNLPTSIQGSNANLSGISGTTLLDYVYDSSHARVKENWVNVGGRGSTTHIGSSFMEITTNSDGTVDYRHYIPTPDGIGGVHTIYGTAGLYNTRTLIRSGTRYWFKDHLGSPVVEYDSGATNLTVLGFDAWGLRRKSLSNQGMTTGDLASYSSPRGYTGHEHLDEVGLVHMNGRIYDPMIGRFLQADPIISEPYNGQNFNRYSYVVNNPLVYTDPSGMSMWTEIRRPVAAIVVAVITWNIVGPWAAAYVAQAGPPTLAAIQGAQLFTAAVSGFAAGGVAGGNLQSALTGALTSAAFFGVGTVFGTHGLSISDFGGAKHVAGIAAHAMVGCVSSVASGGSCGAGAAGAGLSMLATPLIEGSGMNRAVKTGVAAAVGGAGARLGGGSFANGAVTGAFGYLFNQWGSSRRNPYDENGEAATSWQRFKDVWESIFPPYGAKPVAATIAIGANVVIEGDKGYMYELSASLNSNSSVCVQAKACEFRGLGLYVGVGGGIGGQSGHVIDGKSDSTELMLMGGKGIVADISLQVDQTGITGFQRGVPRIGGGVGFAAGVSSCSAAAICSAGKAQ